MAHWLAADTDLWTGTTWIVDSTGEEVTIAPLVVNPLNGDFVGFGSQTSHRSCGLEEISAPRLLPRNAKSLPTEIVGSLFDLVSAPWAILGSNQ
ncbi:hypothetical protein [Lentzea xinjiangensis]|uniref:hypothetical protein n=1 Tax=Lentzea xinjiangensis TaxID=402600 RepID=UPI0011607D97|nr:hypothetical protein [Lentzea xinjiangensis]